MISSTRGHRPMVATVTLNLATMGATEIDPLRVRAQYYSIFNELFGTVLAVHWFLVHSQRLCMVTVVLR